MIGHNCMCMCIVSWEQVRCHSHVRIKSTGHKNTAVTLLGFRRISVVIPITLHATSLLCSGT